MREKDVDGMEVRKERQEHEEHRKGRQRKHGADKIEDGKGGKKSWRGTLGEVVLGAGRHGGVHASRSRTFRLALEPSVRDKKKGRKTRKCKTHAGRPIRPARQSETLRIIMCSSRWRCRCARGSRHVGYLLKARKAARRPSRRTLDAATGAFRRRLAAHASVVAAALDFPFDFAPTRVGMLQADVVGRGVTLMLVEI